MGWKGREFYNSLMQKCLDDNDILLYSRYNEAKSVIAEEFIKTWKGKSYIKMAANDNKCYLGYLIKLVDKYKNTYYRSISKKAIDVDYSALTEKVESSQKTPKFKADDRARLLSTKILLVKVILKISREKSF